MTAAQYAFIYVVLIVCLTGMILLIMDARKKTQQASPGKQEDREQILEMLVQLDDISSISVYKKAYGISDPEITAKRKELKEKQNKQDNVEILVN